MGNLINPNVSRLGYTYFSDTRWMSFLNCNYSFLLSTDFFLYSYINWFIKNYRFLMFFYGTDEQRVSHFNIIRHQNGVTILLFLRLVNFNNRNGNVIKCFLASVRKFFFKLKNLVQYKEQSLLRAYHTKEVALFSKFKKPRFKLKEIYNPYKNSLFKKPIKKLYQFPFWNKRDLSDIHDQYLSKYDRKDLKLESFNLRIFPYDQQKLILKNIYHKFGVVKSMKMDSEKKLKFGTGKFNHLNILKDLFDKKDNKLLWRFYFLQVLLYMLYVKAVRSQVSFNTLILSSFIYKLDYSISYLQMLLLNNFIKLKVYINLYILFLFNKKNNGLNYYNLLWNNHNNFFDSSYLGLSSYINNLKYTSKYLNKRKRKKIIKLFKDNLLDGKMTKNLGYNINLINIFSQKYSYLLGKKSTVINTLEMDDRFKFLHFTPNSTILNNYFLVLFFRYSKLGLVDFKKFYEEYYKLMHLNSSINVNNLVNTYNKIFDTINLNNNFNPSITFFKSRILNMQKTFFVYNHVERSMYRSIQIWLDAFNLGLSYAKSKNYVPNNINLMLLKLSPERLTAPLVNEYIIRNLLIGHSLNRIIYPLINQAYKPFRDNIFCGIKIGCFGRFWRRGRARKVWFNEGSTPLSTISAWVDYKYNFVKLRNGTCSIKVFLTYRKVFNYSI